MADDEEPEEEEELQAVAKHFGKEVDELTLEALIKLEQKTPEEEEEGKEEEEGEDGPKRKAPSLGFILGTMPSAATLGLQESISDCIGEEKENGERSLIFFYGYLILSGFIISKASFFRQNNHIWN